MSSYCLDTSAYSNFRRGNEELAALLDRAELVGVSTVALGELRTGFPLGGRQRRNEAELDAFLDNPAVEVLPVDSETSRHYAEMVAELRDKFAKEKNLPKVSRVAGGDVRTVYLPGSEPRPGGAWKARER